MGNGEREWGFSFCSYLCDFCHAIVHGKPDRGVKTGRMISGMTTPEASHLSGTSSTVGRVRTLYLDGPAGRLEAVLNEGRADAPFAALVCHPHPLGGGNLHNKVVYHAMKALNDQNWGLGVPVLRFNFRGTGLSQGVHDGAAETEDVLAALEWLRREYARPILAAGFSFGAAMTLGAWPLLPTAGLAGRVRAMTLLGLPLRAYERVYQYPALSDCSVPMLLLSGDRDEFAPADSLREIATKVAEPGQLQLLSGADHFFTGRLEEMQKALTGWLNAVLAEELVV